MATHTHTRTHSHTHTHTHTHTRPPDRPPGNCNYAGMFIIWDRIFGTYRAEVVRKDLYGLAKQPMTFDAAKLNTHHFARIADIGARDPPDSVRRRWSYRLLARRVPWRWSMRLSALFDPIPALKRDIRGDGAQRPKWDGAHPMSLATAVFAVVMSVAALVTMVALLLAAKHMHVVDAVMGTLFSGCLLSAVGRVCDQHPGQYRRAMVEAVVMLAAMVGVLYSHPAAAFFGGGGTVGAV